MIHTPWLAHLRDQNPERDRVWRVMLNYLSGGREASRGAAAYRITDAGYQSRRAWA